MNGGTLTVTGGTGVTGGDGGDGIMMGTVTLSGGALSALGGKGASGSAGNGSNGAAFSYGVSAVTVADGYTYGIDGSDVSFTANLTSIP